MTVYTLDPELWLRNRNRLITNRSLMWGSSLVIGSMISFFQIRAADDAVDTAAIEKTFAFLALAFALVAIPSTIFHIRKAKKRYQSFELLISEDSIVRKQFKMPEINIKKDEITRVQAVEGKGLMIKTADPVGMMWIPDELKGYEEVTALLTQWAPEEAPRGTLPLLYNPRASIALAVMGMLALYLVPNPPFVTAVAVLFLGYMIFQALHLLRSPNCTDSGLKIIITTVVATVAIVMRVMAVWR